MSKFISIFGVLCFASLAVACQALSKNTISGVTPTPERLITAIIIPSLTPNLTPSPITPLISAEGISIPTKLTSSHTLTVTPTQTESPIRICSPLIDETIASLWEIVSNPFDSPPLGREDHHHGVDFAYYRRGNRLSIEGETVQSIFSGTVAASIIDRLPYGNMVIIETEQTMLPKEIIDTFGIKPGESLYSLYAHMGQSPQVEIGEQVACGQALGAVGKTGYDIVNPHLHLETRIGPSGTKFNSMAFYDTSATIEEMDNYKRWRTSGEFMPMDPMLIFAEYLSYGNPGFQTPTP